MNHEHEHRGHPTAAMIDVPQLRAMGIEPYFFNELAAMYIEQTPELLREIRTHVSLSELSHFKKAVHNLKGISANIAAQAMVDMCLRLEHVQAHHSPKEITVMLHQLETVYEETRFHLGNIIKKNSHAA